MYRLAAVRAFPALSLLVVATNPFAVSSPLANKIDKPSLLTSIQQRRVSNFGFVAGIRCQIGKSILSKAQAEKAIADEVSPDDIDFLNDKRVVTPLSSYSEYLYNTFEDCTFTSLDIVVNKKIELFREMAELVLHNEYYSKKINDIRLYR